MPIDDLTYEPKKAISVSISGTNQRWLTRMTRGKPHGTMSHIVNAAITQMRERVEKAERDAKTEGQSIKA